MTTLAGTVPTIAVQSIKAREWRGKHTHGWTDALVEEVKSYLKDGLSYSEVEAKLGHRFTRNALIGKMKRVGFKDAAPRILSPRVARRPPLRRVQKATLTLVKPPAPNSEPIEAVALPEPEPLPLNGGRCTIMHLSSRTCRYPIGDPRDEGFCFCGHLPQANYVYCGFHSAIAYQPLVRR